MWLFFISRVYKFRSQYKNKRFLILYINYFIMKTTISTYRKLSLVPVIAFAYMHSASAMFKTDNVSSELRWTNKWLDVAAQDLIWKALGFLWILAVIYLIYWGFMILTASGDENKVKKGKTILFQALLGLVVIFLSYSMVSWVLNSIFGGSTPANS